MIRACSGGDVGIVLAKIAAVELGQRTGALDARRPAADHHDVQRAVVDERGVPVGRLPLRRTWSLSRTASGSVYSGKACSAAPVDAEEVDLRAERRARGSRRRAAPAPRSAPRGASRSTPVTSPDGRARSPACRTDPAADDRPPAARAGRSRAGTGAAGRCGSRACRRARRRRRPCELRAAPIPAKPPPSTRTRGRLPFLMSGRVLKPTQRYDRAASPASSQEDERGPVAFLLRRRREKNPLCNLDVAARPPFWVAACAGPLR